jgi:hypothetical protein
VPFASRHIGGPADPGVQLRPGLLQQAECLHSSSLRLALGPCAYVACCWGRELTYPKALRAALLAASDERTAARRECGRPAAGTKTLVTAHPWAACGRCGVVASLLGEAARRGAAHFLLISDVRVGPPHSTGLGAALLEVRPRTFGTPGPRAWFCPWVFVTTAVYAGGTRRRAKVEAGG